MRPGLMTCSARWGSGSSGSTLAPQDRNNTLTALAGVEPVAGAQHAGHRRLQFFLSESLWDPGRVNARQLEPLLSELPWIFVKLGRVPATQTTYTGRLTASRRWRRSARADSRAHTARGG